MNPFVEDRIQTEGLIRRIVGRLTQDGYQRCIDDKEYVVELRDDGIWIGIRDLPDTFDGMDEDGFSFRVNIEFISEETATGIPPLDAGWRLHVWDRGDNPTPRCIYLTPSEASDQPATNETEEVAPDGPEAIVRPQEGAVAPLEQL